MAHAIVLLSTFSTSPSAADISMTPAELSNSVPSGHRKRSLRTPTATASRQTRDLSNLAGRVPVATLTPTGSIGAKLPCAEIRQTVWKRCS